MSEDRPIKAVFSTGVTSIVQFAQLHEETWEKITRKHGVVQFNDVEATLADPCTVHQSKTHANSVVFVNSKLTTSSGAELRVPVKVFQDKPGIVTSAYYAEANTHGVVIWKRGGDE